MGFDDVNYLNLIIANKLFFLKTSYEKRNSRISLLEPYLEFNIRDKSDQKRTNQNRV